MDLKLTHQTKICSAESIDECLLCKVLQNANSKLIHALEKEQKMTGNIVTCQITITTALNISPQNASLAYALHEFQECVC